MASLPEKASLEPATAKVKSSFQRSIPVGPWSLASGLRARVRICAGAEGAGGLRAEWPQPGVPAAARAQQQPPPPPLQPPPPPPPPPLPGPPPLPMAAPSLAAPGLSGSGEGGGGVKREGRMGREGWEAAAAVQRGSRRAWPAAPGTRAAAAGGSASSGPPGRDPLRRQTPSGPRTPRSGDEALPGEAGLGVSACHLLRAARLPQGHRAC